MLQFKSFSLIPLALLSKGVTFALAEPSTPGHGARPGPPSVTCAKFSIPVNVTANNSIYAGLNVDSNIDAIEYVWDMDTWSHPTGPDRVLGTSITKATFNIAAQLCVPKPGHGTKREILQLATHGSVFTGNYWDSGFEPENYSYVLAAVKAGYSIFSYDRIGTGDSDKPDAYNVTTLPTQIEILKELSLMARSGKLTDIANKHMEPSVVPVFTKVVHVGHSLGSIMTASMLGLHDGVHLSDGVLLTGFAFVNVTQRYGQSGFGWQYAKQNDPVKYRDHGSGYLVVGTESSLHQSFFSNQGLLDLKALAYGNKIKAPSSVGEFRSAGSVLNTPAPSFKGPILVGDRVRRRIRNLCASLHRKAADENQFFLAEYDVLICSGDCNNAYDLPSTKQALFPGASKFEAYIQPKTGHGITLHKNATAGYQVMFDWLSENGL